MMLKSHFHGSQDKLEKGELQMLVYFNFKWAMASQKMMEHILYSPKSKLIEIEIFKSLEISIKFFRKMICNCMTLFFVGQRKDFQQYV